MKSDNGLEKSAILLISLGEEKAAQILKHLDPKEVQKIGQAMINLKTIPRQKIELVVREYVKTIKENSALHVDTVPYVKSVLIKAVGEENAQNLISRITEGGETAGLDGLKWVDSDTIVDLIKDEHPQIIATILVHMEPDQAAEILNKFNERLRNDVVLRIATTSGVQPNALQELNHSMKGLFAGSNNNKKKTVGGVKLVANMLNFMGKANEAVLGAVNEFDPTLGQKIVDEMFVFENLLDLEDRAMQTVLKEVQPDSLIMALKGSSAELKEKIFKNMSQRAAETLREDLENKGPVRLADVETEQKEILKAVRRLAEEGTIMLGGASGEAMV